MQRHLRCEHLDRAPEVQQGPTEPDWIRRHRRRGKQLPKAARSIKPDSPQVGCTYREVGAVRAHFLDRSKPLVHQPPSKASAPEARQEVDVEVRRIALTISLGV